MTREIENDGFITREEDLMRSAKPITICPYPHCEKCENYVDEYCTVPMVITKQIYRFTADRIDALESQLIELETLVYDEILGDNGDYVFEYDPQAKGIGDHTLPIYVGYYVPKREDK